MLQNKKHLGQHWLKDKIVLADIADSAEIDKVDTVLEIGPGLGTLTSHLLSRAKEVVAVEYDADLASKLPGQFPNTKLTVINQDILTFDTKKLPLDYKIVANIPYYITSKIVHYFSTAPNPPKTMVLLVQKEVAQRMAKTAGDYSVLAIASQLYYHVSLGEIVPADLFTPPPKVDSQIVILHRRASPLVSVDDQKIFFRVVKAGFSAKRKKIRSSLAGGLSLSKDQISLLLEKSEIDQNLRAEDLSIDQWQRLAKNYLHFS